MSTPISPEDIAARVGLDAKELERPCEEGLFPSFANYVHPWRLVFSDLLAPIDLDDVDLECHSEQEKRLSCLRKWKTRNGARATVGAVVGSVLRNGSADSAESMCRCLLPGAAIVQNFDMLQVPSAVVQSPASSHDQSPGKSAQSVEMTRSNVEEIKAVFSSLLLSVQSTLELESSADDVRQFMISFFECNFSKTMDIKELLATVTLNHLWDYQHYSPVERLANHLLRSDQGLQDLIKAYKACLSGFYLATKLIDYIECQNLSANDSDEEGDQPSPMFTTKQYRKIKVVLQLERKVSELSLDYVRRLWSSFSDEYELPSLTVVLEKIVTGSIEISWLVPAHVAKIIKPRAKFFRVHQIVQVFVDDVILYDEKEMAVLEQQFLELCQSAATADVGFFSYFLKSGVDPDICDEKGNHPLSYATFDDRGDLVQLLLEFHATIDKETDSGHTALIIACETGNTLIADMLIKNIANVNYQSKNDFGDTALVAAVNNGHLHVAEILVKNGANVNYRNKDERGETALFAASQEGCYDPAELLIEHGADVNYCNKQGDTLLYFASGEGHPVLVELLLAHGADINKGVQSPLYVASLEGNMEMVQLLVHHHAAIDQPCDDEYAATPLIMACEKEHIEKGWSPLQCGCDRGNVDIVKLLIQSNADIGLKNKEGCTGLMIASWRGQLLTVMELIRAGAKTDTQDKEGLTSLMLATQNGHNSVVEALLNANANPNIKENTVGWTALHFATKSANLRISKLLLAKGADTELRDKSGLTAVEICEAEDVCDELRCHTNSQTQTNTQPTELVTVEEQSDSKKGEPTVTENQRNKDLVKKSYHKLLRIFDVLEDSLLPGSKAKKLHQQREASNIVKANQQLAHPHNK